MRPTFPTTCPAVGCRLQGAFAEGVLSCRGGPRKGGGDLEVTASLPGKRVHGRKGLPLSLQLLAHPVPHLFACLPPVPPVSHEGH